MQVDEPKLAPSEKVVPILDRVSEKDIDMNALNQLVMLGYDRHLSMLALKKVGTEYGSLGYDGINKAIDWINRKIKEDEASLLKPTSEEEELIKLEEEATKKSKRLELIKKASSDAKRRYQSLHSNMDNKSTNISINSSEQVNIYAFGKGSKGQLGLGENLLTTAYPTKIRSLQGVKIDKVVCGSRNTLFLSGENQLYKTNMANCKPTRIFERELADERIIEIAAGSGHFIVLNDEGNVLSWGENDYGQLGTGEGAMQKYPKKIETLNKIFINRISCGAAHSMAVSKTGNVFVWGSNIRGQLGYDPKV